MNITGELEAIVAAEKPLRELEAELEAELQELESRRRTAANYLLPSQLRETLRQVRSGVSLTNEGVDARLWAILNTEQMRRFQFRAPGLAPLARLRERLIAEQQAANEKAAKAERRGKIPLQRSAGETHHRRCLAQAGRRAGTVGAAGRAVCRPIRKGVKRTTRQGFSLVISASSRSSCACIAAVRLNWMSSPSLTSRTAFSNLPSRSTTGSTMGSSTGLRTGASASTGTATGRLAGMVASIRLSATGGPSEGRLKAGTHTAKILEWRHGTHALVRIPHRSRPSFDAGVETTPTRRWARRRVGTDVHHGEAVGPTRPTL